MIVRSSGISVARWREEDRSRLTTETVKGTALALEGVHNIERGNRLSFGVLLGVS
jgi:hypothetical protein